jgi:hypothetical protein
MSEFDPEMIVRRADLLGSRVQDEMVFFDQRAGKYYATGSVGADIWEFLGEQRSIGAICQHLEAIYEIDTETCKAEVIAFLRAMQDANMVNVTAP